jgi:hypothetical protein
MSNQIYDRENCLRAVNCLNVEIAFCCVIRVVKILVGSQALDDRLWRQELRVASKPVHAVHLLVQLDVLHANFLDHVDRLLVDVPLQEGPYLVKLVRYHLNHVRRNRARNSLLCSLNWYAVDVLDVNDLLLEHRQLVLESLKLVRGLSRLSE